MLRKVLAIGAVLALSAGCGGGGNVDGGQPTVSQERADAIALAEDINVAIVGVNDRSAAVRQCGADESCFAQATAALADFAREHARGLRQRAKASAYTCLQDGGSSLAFALQYYVLAGDYLAQRGDAAGARRNHQKAQDALGDTATALDGCAAEIQEKDAESP